MKWTKEEEEKLKELYMNPDYFARDIAEIIGRTTRQIYCKVQAMGLKAPKERIIRAALIGTQSENSIAHRFKKGLIPANKGKKMSPEQYAKCAPTMFKKGNVSKNKKKVWSERVNVDGYVEIKIADPDKWMLKHRWIWEQHNGKIPKGYNIQFKNGNTQDVRIENLYMISQADQLRNENSYMARYPKELQEVLRLKGTVKRQITLIKKKAKSNEQ